VYAYYKYIVGRKDLGDLKIYRWPEKPKNQEKNDNIDSVSMCDKDKYEKKL